MVDQLVAETEVDHCVTASDVAPAAAMPHTAVYTVSTQGDDPLSDWPDRESAHAFLRQATYVARQNFTRVVVHTDTPGKQLLRGLEFDEVVVSLDGFDIHPAVRCAARLETCAQQEGPFFHMDWDFVLWNRRNDRLRRPVVAQSRTVDSGRSRLALLWRAVSWKPAFIDKFLEEYTPMDLPCPTILGGTDMEFLRWYSSLALEILRHPSNHFMQELADSRLGALVGIGFEQWLLAACAKQAGIEIHYLADEPTPDVNATHVKNASRLGFSNLAGKAKSSEYWRREIERRNVDAGIATGDLAAFSRQREAEPIDLDAISCKVLISMEKQVERRAFAQRQFAELGLDVEWKIPVRIPDLRWTPGIQGYRSRAASASHAVTVVEVLEEAERRGAETLMLFEDDVIFHPHFSTLLPQIRVPSDWQFIYLGGRNCGRMQYISRGLARSDFISDLHAVIVRAEMFSLVKRALLDPCIHSIWLDFRIATLHERHPAYLCRPNLAWQTPHLGDAGTGAEYCNYHEDGTVKFGQGN